MLCNCELYCDLKYFSWDLHVEVLALLDYISFGSNGQLGKGLRNSLLVSMLDDGPWEELILD